MRPKNTVLPKSESVEAKTAGVGPKIARVPLAIDLFCGLGGWAEGFLAEGWRVIGFDIERHDYGTRGYPGHLVLQDVTTLHGSQFKTAAVIVASPPCQAYSYRAMPWSRAKELPPPDNKLFETCFRIHRQACKAAGHYIPMVVENVRGAQKWLGRAQAHFGSYYLWGDVGMVGNRVVAGVPRFGESVVPMKSTKNNGGSWFAVAHNTTSGHSRNPVTGEEGKKTTNIAHKRDGYTHTRHLTNQRESEAVKNDGRGWRQNWTLVSSNRMVPDGIKHGGDCFSDPAWPAKQGGTKQAGISGPRDNGKGDKWFQDGAAKHGSRSNSRKAASAMIAKIPFALAQYIASCYKPDGELFRKI